MQYLSWTPGCCMTQPTAQTHQKTRRKAMTATRPRTSYLSRRAAAAGSQCKCSCCLRHPPGAGWDHPRHIWHSLHSGLSHLSQSLCRLSPAWKDPKPQTFLGVAWTCAGTHPGSTQPSAAPAYPPFVASFDYWALCFDVSAKGDCTLSQIRELVWTGTNLFHSRLVWTPVPSLLLHYVPWWAQSRERPRWKSMAWGMQGCFFQY